MDYMKKNDVELTLRAIGLRDFTVAFDKKDGGHRIMTGVLVEAITGPLEDTVTMLTENGYRSFNATKVTQIALDDEGVLQDE